jgi:D-alanyl-D-alanine carboxypeptidase/D-alanyl-D-alanine-endopeptidase (penicillin-binding protein 4)
MLKYSKIKVRGHLKIRYKNQIKNKKNVKLLYSYRTKYLLDTLIVMNRYSNNFIAEQLLKIVGAKFNKDKGIDEIASWESGIKAVKEMLEKDINISPDSYKYTNASGLNDANFFSSYQIAKILYYIKSNFNYKWYLLSTLPKIGVSGTLRRYCLSEDCKGAVIAKTGSLRTTVALAGFINVSNRLYTFSLAVNFDSSKKKFRSILKQAKNFITNLISLDSL